MQRESIYRTLWNNLVHTYKYIVEQWSCWRWWCLWVHLPTWLWPCPLKVHKKYWVCCSKLRNKMKCDTWNGSYTYIQIPRTSTTACVFWLSSRICIISENVGFCLSCYGSYFASYMLLLQYVDLCFHTSFLLCLHTFQHAIPASFYIFNVFIYSCFYS